MSTSPFLASASGVALVAVATFICGGWLGWPRWPPGVSPTAFPMCPRGLADPGFRQTFRDLYFGWRLALVILLIGASFGFCFLTWDAILGEPITIAGKAVRLALAISVGFFVVGQMVTRQMRRELVRRA
jgi:hypothetical protein